MGRSIPSLQVTRRGGIELFSSFDSDQVLPLPQQTDVNSYYTLFFMPCSMILSWFWWRTSTNLCMSICKSQSLLNWYGGWVPLVMEGRTKVISHQILEIGYPRMLSVFPHLITVKRKLQAHCHKTSGRFLSVSCICPSEGTVQFTISCSVNI